MKDIFDTWNSEKKKLHTLLHFPHPKRRQVWWCTIGHNIGSEQNCEEGFDRPVLVLKVFGTLFWGLPITSSDPKGKKKTNPLYFSLESTGATSVDNAKKLTGYVAVHQLRVFDCRRLKRKILRLDTALFSEILREVRAYLI